MTKEVSKKIVKKIAKKATKKVVKKAAPKKAKIVDCGVIEVNIPAKIELTKEQKDAQKVNNKLIKFCEKNKISIVGTIKINDLFSVRSINTNSTLEELGMEKFFEGSL